MPSCSEEVEKPLTVAWRLCVSVFLKRAFDVAYAAARCLVRHSLIKRRRNFSTKPAELRGLPASGVVYPPLAGSDLCSSSLYCGSLARRSLDEAGRLLLISKAVVLALAAICRLVHAPCSMLLWPRRLISGSCCGSDLRGSSFGGFEALSFAVVLRL